MESEKRVSIWELYAKEQRIDILLVLAGGILICICGDSLSKANTTLSIIISNAGMLIGCIISLFDWHPDRYKSIRDMNRKDVENEFNCSEQIADFIWKGSTHLFIRGSDLFYMEPKKDIKDAEIEVESRMGKEHYYYIFNINSKKIKVYAGKGIGDMEDYKKKADEIVQMLY